MVAVEVVVELHVVLVEVLYGDLGGRLLLKARAGAGLAVLLLLVAQAGLDQVLKRVTVYRIQCRRPRIL